VRRDAVLATKTQSSGMGKSAKEPAIRQSAAEKKNRGRPGRDHARVEQHGGGNQRGAGEQKEAVF